MIGDGVSYHDGATIRFMEDGGEPIDARSRSVVREAVRLSLSKLKPGGHLFVTVVGGHTIRTGEGDDECGFGLYHSGVRHVMIAGSFCHEQDEIGYEDWLRELAKSTVHEVVHYWQEMNGTLGMDESSEDEAESIAEKIVSAMEIVK